MADAVFEEDLFCFALSVDQVGSYCHSCLANVNRLRRCSGCKMQAYCSAVCQRKDWRLHKSECLAIKVHDGIANDGIRLVMRLAVKWSEGEVGGVVIEGEERSLSTLEEHSCEMEEYANAFLSDYKQFVTKTIVSDGIVKRLFKKVAINSFSLSNQFGNSIGIGLCIRLSKLEHSCCPNMRVAYRGLKALMMPTSLLAIPTSFNSAHHSYIDELQPLAERRKELKDKYKFDCNCSGCLDVVRNNLMESWACPICQSGWMKAAEKTRCEICGYHATSDHISTCHLAVEAAKAGNVSLRRNDISLESKRKLAEQLISIFENALHKHNVLRLPALRSLFKSAILSKDLKKVLLFGSDIISIHQCYQHEDDLVICHLKYGVAQALKALGMENDCRIILEKVKQVYGRAYGINSQIYFNVQTMMK